MANRGSRTHLRGLHPRLKGQVDQEHPVLLPEHVLHTLRRTQRDDATLSNLPACSSLWLGQAATDLEELEPLGWSDLTVAVHVKRLPVRLEHQPKRRLADLLLVSESNRDRL